jgi:hypothetical protein
MHCNCNIKVFLVRLKKLVVKNPKIGGIVISIFTEAFKGSYAYFMFFLERLNLKRKIAECFICSILLLKQYKNRFISRKILDNLESIEQ